MSIIDLFFTLYDTDNDGIIRSFDLLEMSKELLSIFQTMQILDNEHLESVTALLLNAYEQSDIVSGKDVTDDKRSERKAKYTLPEDIPIETLMMHLDTMFIGDDELELSLPSFRMVILTNETLELFFDRSFPESFTLTEAVGDSQKSFGREIFDHLFVSGQTLASRKPASPGLKAHSPSLSPSVSQRTNSPSSAQSGSPVVDNDLIDFFDSTNLESSERKGKADDTADPKKPLPLDDFFRQLDHFDSDDGYQII